MLCTLLLGGQVPRRGRQPGDARRCARVYRPVLAWRARAPGARRSRSPRCCSSARCVVARGIGSEFMPPLNEGDLMFMPIADPSISLEENTKIAAQQNAALMTFPEVEYAVAKVGAGRHVDRSVAAEHDRDDRPPEAAGAVAAGHDARSAARRDGTRRPAAGRRPTSGRCRSSTASTC